ncbi:MAG: alpha,alpha-phosphotrehalase [Lachnospiraceae bacterium]|nr:alpha,alpha-phosphotrehalase [Lachnospiraceae bacterium]
MADFKDKVVYQIYPKSFRDSNGDGIGDLPGIIEKLDYLKMLGVDYLWITPFFPSPQRDNGYDVSDYTAVDPRFGTMEDFEQLIREAENRQIGIMLDMVFNHTSTEHEWFQKALAGEEKYQNYYIWREGSPDRPPTNWESKFGGPAWEYVPALGKWYLHLFDVTQADLNWENPEVREELKNVIRFWKQKGVRGFRFDVVNLISKPEIFEDDPEGDGRRFYTDGHHVHGFLKELVRDTQIEDMVTVGEMSSTTLENCIRYSNPEEKELSMCFNFHHLKIDYKDGNKWALMEPDRKKLKKLFQVWQEGMQQENGWNAVFWCNHDQPRIVTRLGDEKRYWKESAKMLAACIHLMRGTPYIYQGEELGMTNAHYTTIEKYQDVESLNYYKILLEQGKTEAEALEILAARSRDNSRSPMQWSSEPYAGFSDVQPWISLPDNWQTINVQTQLQDETSIMAFYRRLISLRKSMRIISEGTIHFLPVNEENIIAYERRLKNEHMAVFCNLSSETMRIDQSAEEISPELSGDYPKMQETAWEPYRKILGNYDETDRENGSPVLKPYEVIVLYHC